MLLQLVKQPSKAGKDFLSYARNGVMLSIFQDFRGAVVDCSRRTLFAGSALDYVDIALEMMQQARGNAFQLSGVLCYFDCLFLFVRLFV